MFDLGQKLTRLKSVLKIWNKEKFGDVHMNVDTAMQKLKSVQDEMENTGCTDNLLVQGILLS